MKEPAYMCASLDRILSYMDNVEYGSNLNRKNTDELDKARREIERLRIRISNLREWGTR